jgi:hypothetical protein
MELETGGLSWWSAIIRECASYGQTIATDCFCLSVFPLLNGLLNGTYSAQMLLQFFFRMTICFVHGFGGFTQGVKMAQLVWHIWQDSMDGIAERMLTIRDGSTKVGQGQN